MMENCKICLSSLRNGKATVLLRSKGSEGINSASESRSSNVGVSPGEKVHVVCRARWINKKQIEADKRQPAAEPQADERLRSSAPHFNIEKDCFFCGTSVGTDYKSTRYTGPTHSVLTLGFHSSLRKVCTILFFFFLSFFLGGEKI